jgi:GST-like protein
MACYPWIVPYKNQQQNLDDFPHLKRWFDALKNRPAIARAYQKGEAVSNRPSVTEESRKILFGQTAASIDKPS